MIGVEPRASFGKPASCFGEPRTAKCFVGIVLAFSFYLRNRKSSYSMRKDITLGPEDILDQCIGTSDGTLIQVSLSRKGKERDIACACDC